MRRSRQMQSNSSGGVRDEAPILLQARGRLREGRRAMKPLTPLTPFPVTWHMMDVKDKRQYLDMKRRELKRLIDKLVPEREGSAGR